MIRVLGYMINKYGFTRHLISECIQLLLILFLFNKFEQISIIGINIVSQSVIPKKETII